MKFRMHFNNWILSKVLFSLENLLWFSKLNGLGKFMRLVDALVQHTEEGRGGLR